ncbi:hypothetical protein R1sor_000914 [Riccia sorocarpa]|uniref:Uncharacterized protein n=1 Tax=Riccia sorocarpa TaxID=122646 RepID=A0ABD3GUG4_9MARC
MDMIIGLYHHWLPGIRRGIQVQEVDLGSDMDVFIAGIRRGIQVQEVNLGSDMDVFIAGSDVESRFKRPKRWTWGFDVDIFWEEILARVFRVA